MRIPSKNLPNMKIKCAQLIKACSFFGFIFFMQKVFCTIYVWIFIIFISFNRNLSSVSERTRQQMRDTNGLVDALVGYVQKCLPDTKIEEKVIVWHIIYRLLISSMSCVYMAVHVNFSLRVWRTLCVFCGICPSNCTVKFPHQYKHDWRVPPGLLVLQRANLSAVSPLRARRPKTWEAFLVLDLLLFFLNSKYSGICSSNNVFLFSEAKSGPYHICRSVKVSKRYGVAVAPSDRGIV